jgi:hypothetical protein
MAYEQVTARGHHPFVNCDGAMGLGSMRHVAAVFKLVRDLEVR